MPGGATLDAALAAIAEPWGWSDCDYARGIAATGTGRDTFAAWLRQRFADHDRLILGQIVLGGQDGLVMGVSFARRTSDTLRSRGLPDGDIRQWPVRRLTGVLQSRDDHLDGGRLGGSGESSEAESIAPPKRTPR